jgi:cyclic-di-AMP phosphodiesterase PgpH
VCATHGVILCGILTVLFAVHLSTPSLRVGQVSEETIIAPHRITYVDRVATQALRRQAESQVPAVYAFSNDLAMQRERQANAFMARVAPVLEGSASPAHKLSIIKSLVPPGVAPGQLQHLLGLTSADLGIVQYRSQALLSQAASSPFDENQAPGTELGLLATLPGLLSQKQKVAIGTVVGMFLTPTQSIDVPATERKRLKAAQSVPDVVNTIYQDQVVVRRGDVITPSIGEQIRALGLQNKQTGWQDVVGGTLYAILILTLLFWYFSAFQPGVLANSRIMLLIDICIVVTVTGARVLAANHVLLPYFLPVAAATTFAAALIAPEACVALALALALLSAWVASSSYELAIYYFATAATGALAVRQIRQLKQFIIAGAYITAAALATAVAFGFVDRVYDLSAMQDYVLAAVFNGFVSSALALGAFALLSSIFGVTTTLQLLELGQPSQPLLRKLMVKAPGTYNHSLILTTMVENAAEMIGANSLASKLGALYHDVGKTINPHAFVENQLGMSNIHDDLPPEESARIIRGHVHQGLRLARQYRLPRLVHDAIAEHHGTMAISYFLHRAREMNDGEPLDVGLFMYPGPKPQSKETALIMLADGCEAAVRASNDHSAARIGDIIDRIMQDRMSNGQLDECPLTLRDLQVTREAFCSVLTSLYHPRVEYPEPAEPIVTQTETVPSLPDEPDVHTGRRVAL